MGTCNCPKCGEEVEFEVCANEVPAAMKAAALIGSRGHDGCGSVTHEAYQHRLMQFVARMMTCVDEKDDVDGYGVLGWHNWNLPALLSRLEVMVTKLKNTVHADPPAKPENVAEVLTRAAGVGNLAFMVFDLFDLKANPAKPEVVPLNNGDDEEESPTTTGPAITGAVMTESVPGNGDEPSDLDEE